MHKQKIFYFILFGFSYAKYVFMLWQFSNFCFLNSGVLVELSKTDNLFLKILLVLMVIFILFGNVVKVHKFVVFRYCIWIRNNKIVFINLKNKSVQFL